LFFAFSIKIPLFPFHILLSEARVEAPTSGSILLASLLLKLGGYGIIKFLIGLFPAISYYYSPYIVLFALLKVIFSSLTAIRQLDFKRPIAYPSVAHINYVVIGLFNTPNYSISSGVLLMISHGIIAAALFVIVGILYERRGTRHIRYYSGLITLMPIFSMFFIIFSFSNMSFPGLGNFPGELLILMGIVDYSFSLAIIVSVGLFLTGVYSIWLLNRILFGTYTTYKHNNSYLDINFREFTVLLALLLINLIIGC
jgi:NADH-quinone oxidoreductase subunit M